MVNPALAKRIEAPAEVVWNLVNWKGCEALMPVPGQMEKVTFHGDGIGATRVFHADRERLGGGTFTEQLVDIDDGQRWYRYRLCDNGTLPWTGYVGEIRVTPAGPDACAILFTAEIHPVEISDEECNHIFVTHALMDVARVKDYLGVG